MKRVTLRSRVDEAGWTGAKTARSAALTGANAALQKYAQKKSG